MPSWLVLATLIAFWLPSAPGDILGTAADTQGLPKLEFPGTSDALDPLFKSLRELDRGGAEKVRVAHFGDSHIAADIFTGRMRDRMQMRFGDGGRGFLLPGRPWSGYRPHKAATGHSGKWSFSNALYARTKRTEHIGKGIFGLGGFAACTEDLDASFFVELARSGEILLGEVYAARGPEGGEFCIETPRGAKDCFDTQGDDAALGVYPFRFDPLEDKRASILQKSGENCFLGVSVEDDAPGVVYDSLGINGARLSTLDNLTSPYFEEILVHRKYNLLVLSYGTNETVGRSFDASAYLKKGNQVLKRLLDYLPGSACLLVGPPLFSTPRSKGVVPSPHIHQAIEVQKELASRHNCAYFDTYAWMGGDDALQRWIDTPREMLEGFRQNYHLKLDVDLVLRAGKTGFSLLSRDHVHYRRDGYHLLADLLFEVLMRHYEGYLHRVSKQETPTTNLLPRLSRR